MYLECSLAEDREVEAPEKVGTDQNTVCFMVLRMWQTKLGGSKQFIDNRARE